jgi:hypothetical protein
VSINRILRLPRHRITGRETARFEFASPENLDELSAASRTLFLNAIRIEVALDFDCCSDDEQPDLR